MTTANENDLDPVLTNDFCENQFKLLLKNLHQNYENQASSVNNLLQTIKHQNTILTHRLRLNLNEDIRKTLEANLKNNNHLIHYLLELGNLFLNNEQYYEWLKLELQAEETEIPEVAPANTLEENAQKARFYPHPTPFHFTPLRSDPYT